MLTSKQRAILRKAAHDFEPVFQVGKGEIDENLIQSTAECLAARELIKLKVLAETSPYTAREAADKLAEATGAEVVQVIGNKFVLYRQKAEEPQYVALLGGKPAPRTKASARAKAGGSAKQAGRAKPAARAKAAARARAAAGEKPSVRGGKTTARTGAARGKTAARPPRRPKTTK